MKDKKICVIGLGYIGLPTAAILASKKINVLGVDIRADIVEIINQGKIHITEPNLEDLVSNAVSEGYLSVSESVEPSDVFFITVPTPIKEDHSPDLSYIESATKSIIPFLKKGNIIILESTSPVGTTEQILKWITKSRKDLNLPQDICIAYCPERVLPGCILHELVHNDRVIGGITDYCAQKASEVYNLFVHGKIHLTQSKIAEMIKLTENSFRDVNIAFSNEISMMCDKFNINILDVIKLANQHPRVNILNPGIGVGGHCIAVDPWFLIHANPEQSTLIRSARSVNTHKTKWILEKIYQKLKTIKKPQIAILGLSFKPNVDDLRESPAMHITEELSKKYNLLIVEPHISELPFSLKKNTLCNLENALKDADIVIALVKHDAFLNLELKNNQILFDEIGMVEQRAIL